MSDDPRDKSWISLFPELQRFVSDNDVSDTRRRSLTIVYGKIEDAPLVKELNAKITELEAKNAGLIGALFNATDTYDKLKDQQEKNQIRWLTEKGNLFYSEVRSHIEEKHHKNCINEKRA